MSENKVHRVTNLQSFDEVTKEPRQIAGLYFYHILDSLVDLAHEVAVDFRKRPQLYRNLGHPSVAATLARLNAEYGTQVVLPSRGQRAEIYAPVFGTSENDGFTRARNSLFSAVRAYAEHAATRGIEMLRENVRVALRPFRSYLLTLQGDSVKFSKEAILSELTETFCYPVLRNEAVAAVFGIAKHAATEYPYATDPAEDLLVEAISTQLKSGGNWSINITRDRISNLQTAAVTGTQAIATVIDFEEAKAVGTDAELDSLITSCYAWEAALASLKPSSRLLPGQNAQPGQQGTSSSTQRTVSGASGSATATQAAMQQPTTPSRAPAAVVSTRRALPHW